MQVASCILHLKIIMHAMSHKNHGKNQATVAGILFNCSMTSYIVGL